MSKNPKKKVVKPEDFQPTQFNQDEVDQIVTEAWRRISPLKPDQRIAVINKLYDHLLDVQND